MLGEEMAVGSQPLFTPSLPSPPLVHPTAHISSLWPCSSKFLFPCSLRKAHPWEGELQPEAGTILRECTVLICCPKTSPWDLQRPDLACFAVPALSWARQAAKYSFFPSKQALKYRPSAAQRCS